MGSVHRTPLEDVRIDAWVALSGTHEITRAPLLDASQELLFARLDYRDALIFAESVGATLPTKAQMIELLKVGYLLRPVILPSAAQRARVPRCKGETELAYETRLRLPMSSVGWCRVHDEAVAQRLTGIWDGRAPLVNAGKQWIAGAPKGRAYLMGWYSGDSWIQSGAVSGPGPHDDRHVDYSMCTMLVRPRQVEVS